MKSIPALRVNTLWMIVGDVGSRIIGLGFGIILARILLPEDFGLVVTAQVITGAFGYVAAGGMSDALIRAPSVSTRDRDTVFTAQLVISLTIFALLQVLAPTVALLFRDERLELVLRVAALTFVMRPFMYVPLTILQREMRFREASILLFVTILTSGAVSTLMAFAGFGVWSLILGGLTGAAVRIVVLMVIAPWLPALAWDGAAARRLGAFGLRVSAIDFIQFIRAQSTNALVSRTLGVANVGLYNKADSLSELPFEVLSTAAYQTLFRALSVIAEDIPASAGLFLRSLGLVCLYALPCYVGLAWVAHPLVLLLFGANWAPVAIPLQVLCLAGIFRILSNLSSAVTAAQDRLAQEIPIQLQSLALTLVGVLIGLGWGIGGVAVGVLVGLVYNGARLYGLAASTLGIGWVDLGRSLAPVLWLNLVLMLALALGHLTLHALAVDPTGPVYLGVMILIGACTYGGHFLLLPPPALGAESARWRGEVVARLGRRPPG